MGAKDYTETAGGAERAYSYLLGEMDEAEQVRFERDFLADADAYELYLAAQDELMEAYTRGEMTPERRARFDRHFLTTDARRERLRLISDLDEHAAGLLAAEATTRPVESSPPASEPRPARSFASRLRASFGLPRPRFALAPAFALAALFVLVSFVGWRLLLERNPIESEQAQSSTPPATPQARPDGTPAGTPASPPPAAGTSPPAITEQAASVQPSPPAPSAPVAPGRANGVKVETAQRRAAPPSVSYALTLLPLSTREAGDGARPLRLRPSADGTLRLRLVLEDAGGADAVRAQVQTAEGVGVFARDKLRVRRQRGTSFVTLNLATASLADGDYTIKLTGPEVGGEAVVVRYSFGVTRR